VSRLDRVRSLNQLLVNGTYVESQNEMIWIVDFVSWVGVLPRSPRIDLAKVVSMKLDDGSWPNSYSCCPTLDITVNNVRLRPLHWKDRVEIRRWRNAQLPVLRQRTELTAKQQDEYFRLVVANEMKIKFPPQILLGIESSGDFVAYGGLVHIGWLDRHAEMSFLADPAYCSRNDYHQLLTTFIELLSQLALKELGLHRLFTETYSFRTEHIEMLESAGFCREGVLEEHVLIDGEYVNSILHGLILE